MQTERERWGETLDTDARCFYVHIYARDWGGERERNRESARGVYIQVHIYRENINRERDI